MAYRPPGLAPVLGLGQVTKHSRDPEDDEPSFARFGDLPPELRTMVYKYYFNDLDIVYSCEYKYDDQPGLVRKSNPLRAEALPVFYSHSTFAAEIDIWPPVFDGVPPAHLDDSTQEMLFNLHDVHLCRIRHIQLTLDFDIEPLRRFVVTFDLTQWQDFNRAIRIERIVPGKHVHYVDTFRLGIQRRMRRLFETVPRRPYLEGRPRCDDVLETAAKLLNKEFKGDEYWIEEAYNECIEAARNFRRRERFELLKLRFQSAVMLFNHKHVINLDVFSRFLAVTFLFYTPYTHPLLYRLSASPPPQPTISEIPRPSSYRSPRLSSTTAIHRAEVTRQQPQERSSDKSSLPAIQHCFAPHPVVIMVQFKSTITGGRLKRKKHRSNTYWMLGPLVNRSAHDMRKDLEERGYQCRKSASKAVIADSLGRLQRGLISYEQFGVAELQAFCKARGLSSKAATVSRLARDSTNHAPEATSGHTKPAAKTLVDVVSASLKHDFGVWGDAWGLQDGSDQPLRMKIEGVLSNDMKAKLVSWGGQEKTGALMIITD